MGVSDRNTLHNPCTAIKHEVTSKRAQVKPVESLPDIKSVQSITAETEPVDDRGSPRSKTRTFTTMFKAKKN